MKSLNKMSLIATAVFASMMTHAEMQSMDDSSMSNVSGQGGVSLAGDVSQTVGKLDIGDSDCVDCIIRMENVVAKMTIDDAKPIMVDVVHSKMLDKDGKVIKQIQMAMPEVKANMSVDAMRVGSNGASMNSLALNDATISSNLRIWGH